MSARRRDGRLELALDRSWELEPNTWSSMTWWDPVPCGDSLFSSVLSEHDKCPPPSPTTSLYTNPPTPFEFRDPPPTPTNFSFRSSASSGDPAAPRRISDENIFSPLSWPLPTTPAGTAWSPCAGLSSSSSHWPTSSLSTYTWPATTNPHTWTSSSTSPNNWPHTASSSSSPLAWPLAKTPSPDYSHYSVFSSSMYSDDPIQQHNPLAAYPIFPTPPDTNVPPPPLRTALQDTSRAPPLLPTPPSTEERHPNLRRGLRRSQKQVFKFPVPPPPPGSLGPFLAPPPSGLPPIDITRHPPPTLRPPSSVCLK